jgi:molecular chaperone DnaK (HSP70)
VSYSLGVDLGTTYSAAAVCDGGVAQIVSLGQHAFVVPSVIFVGDDGQFLVGEPAERRAGSDPTRVAREFKRRIGDPPERERRRGGQQQRQLGRHDQTPGRLTTPSAHAV